MVELKTDSEKLGYLKGVLFNIQLVLKYRGTSSVEALYAIQEQVRRIEEETDILTEGL